MPLPRSGALLAIGSGLLVPLALAPFDFWPLVLLAPPMLLAALLQVPSGHGGWAFLFGYLHGLARYGLGVSWVYVSIHVYGPAPPWLAGSLVVLFVAGLALLPAVMSWLFVRLAWNTERSAAVGFVALWVLLEWMLTWLLTGFPWLLLGYAHLSSPLAGLAPVGGVLLVSLASVVSGVAVYLAWRGGLRWPVTVLGLALLWLGAAGLREVNWTRPAAEPLQVALVQGVIPQDLKWQSESREAILQRYLRLSDAHWQDADWILWPEAALTWFARDAGGLLDELGRHAAQHQVALTTGIPDYERTEHGVHFQNTAVNLGLGEGRYVKQRLVPFGEYVPFESLLRGLISFFDLPMSHARPGPADQPPMQVHGHGVAMAICYEVVYPDLVRRQGRDAALLATLSNDTWFGDSLGPEQHLQMARMRALEQGRWLVRATNDGVTAIVAPDGSMAARLQRFEPGVLTGEVTPMTGMTPFLRTGSAPAVVAALLLLLAGLVAGRRQQ